MQWRVSEPRQYPGKDHAYIEVRPATGRWSNDAVFGGLKAFDAYLQRQWPSEYQAFCMDLQNRGDDAGALLLMPITPMSSGYAQRNRPKGKLSY